MRIVEAGANTEQPNFIELEKIEILLIEAEVLVLRPSVGPGQGLLFRILADWVGLPMGAGDLELDEVLPVPGHAVHERGKAIGRRTERSIMKTARMSVGHDEYSDFRG